MTLLVFEAARPAWGRGASERRWDSRAPSTSSSGPGWRRPPWPEPRPALLSGHHCAPVIHDLCSHLVLNTPKPARAWIPMPLVLGMAKGGQSQTEGPGHAASRRLSFLPLCHQPSLHGRGLASAHAHPSTAAAGGYKEPTPHAGHSAHSPR